MGILVAPVLAQIDVLITALGGVIGAAIAAGATYLVAIRGKSGRVGTSEAETLWDEASKMREIYRQEAAQLRQDARDLRIEVLGLRDDIVRLRTETNALRAEALSWRTEALRLRMAVGSARSRQPGPLTEAAIEQAESVLDRTLEQEREANAVHTHEIRGARERLETTRDEENTRNT